jgi:putative transposase
MPLTRHLISTFAHFILLVRHLVADFAGLATSRWRSRGALTAENLFLRKQLALFQERKVKPHRATDATRFMMVLLERFFDWRSALVVVKPDTLIRWHRKGFRLFWRWKSKLRGRPKFPAKLREFIREMAAANPNWGVARIADELLLKLGIRVSPPHGRQVSIQRVPARAHARPQAVLDDLRPQPRSDHRGLRLTSWS